MTQSLAKSIKDKQMVSNSIKEAVSKLLPTA
jgi:hypothetical protein